MSKYVYANIRVPIKVSDDLTVFDILSEHMTIEFEACSDLESGDTNLMNKLMSLGDLGITKSLFETDVNEQPEHELPEHEQEQEQELPEQKGNELSEQTIDEQLSEKDVVGVSDGKKNDQIDCGINTHEVKYDDASDVTIKINRGLLPNARTRENLTFRVMPNNKQKTTTQTRKLYVD